MADGALEFGIAGPPPSAYEQVTRTRVETLEKKFDQHLMEQADALKALREELQSISREMLRRLPLWATFTLSLATAVIAALLTIVWGG